MARRLVLALALLACPAAWAQTKVGIQGSCRLQNLSTSSFGCTITVYNTGTTNLATIFADSSGTAKSNPFTIGANSTKWIFYLTQSNIVDIVFSGGNPSISPSYTIPSVNAALLSVVVPSTATASTTLGHQIYNSGTTTFTIPSGVTALKITVIGGGGAGGGGTTTTAQPGNGGGSGAVGVSWLTNLTSGNTLTVTVGAGGTGSGGISGSPGGASSVSSGTQIITTINAPGGGGGGGAGAQGSGLAGAVGTGGQVNFGGSPGYLTIQTGVNNNTGSGGGPSIYGGGGNSQSGGLNGNAGTAYGAGGGGGGSGGLSATAGGAGGNGAVIFEWTSVAVTIQ